MWKMKILMKILKKKLKNFHLQNYANKNLKKFQITTSIFLMLLMRQREKSYKQPSLIFLQNNKYLNLLAA